MKSKRHEMILKIITQYDIDTQDELLSRLQEDGIKCTQATISRDIRDLKIIKAAAGKGKYKYVRHVSASETALQSRFANILREAVASVDYAMNIVVVKAFTGMASAAGAAIDSMKLSGVVGSVAGDDTLIMIARTEDDAAELYTQLSAVIHHEE